MRICKEYKPCPKNIKGDNSMGDNYKCGTWVILCDLVYSSSYVCFQIEVVIISSEVWMFMHL